MGGMQVYLQSLACHPIAVSTQTKCRVNWIKLLIIKTNPEYQTIKLAWIGGLTGECLLKEIGNRSKWIYSKLYTRIKNKYKE